MVPSLGFFIWPLFHTCHLSHQLNAANVSVSLALGLRPFAQTEPYIAIVLADLYANPFCRCRGGGLNKLPNLPFGGSAAAVAAVGALQKFQRNTLETAEGSRDFIIF